ncbi:hypothetical protein FRB90_010913, partial [Tulasnella sp. 427]
RMDLNEELAKDTGAQTTRLLALLQHFDDGSKEGGLIADRVNDLHRELQDILAKLTVWTSMNRFKKGFSARDHEETLKKHQAGLQALVEQMQFLVSLDIRDMTAELRSTEIQKEKHRLLNLLGDGKFGARGHSLDEILCFPGTRVAILERVDSWIKDPAVDSRVLWIRGMAGRGKSTIASTVVHNWKTRSSCAIFHFRRGQIALNARVVCALARQLGSTLSPQVKGAVLDALRENQDIVDKQLEEQFETLLVASLSKLDNHTHPILFVLDALDESDESKEAIALINFIDRHSPSFPPNVKFLLTCRPEGSLSHTLESHGWRQEDLDVDADVTDDIKTFLLERLCQTRHAHRLSESWPQPEQVVRLVEMSQGLFQWARTALNYIHDGSPTDRLRILLKHPERWS